MNRVGNQADDTGSDRDSDLFPSTVTYILERAAAGDWDPFVDRYFKPCCREIRICCAQNRIQMADSDDLMQDLWLQLMKEQEIRRPGDKPAAAAAGGPEQPPGDKVVKVNIPGRHLLYRKGEQKAARFRTVVKAVIKNLMYQLLRRSTRDGEPLSDVDCAQLAEEFREPVTAKFEDEWLSGCLLEAAEEFRDSCKQKKTIEEKSEQEKSEQEKSEREKSTEKKAERKKTKAEKRLFEVFYWRVVGKVSNEQIADKFGIQARSVAENYAMARKRFVEILLKVTGIDDEIEVSAILAKNPELFFDAIRDAGKEYANEK